MKRPEDLHMFSSGDLPEEAIDLLARAHGRKFDTIVVDPSLPFQNRTRKLAR